MNQRAIEKIIELMITLCDIEEKLQGIEGIVSMSNVDYIIDKQ